MSGLSFIKLPPLYKTTKGGGLPDSLSSVELIEGASKRIFNDSAMRRALGILEIPLLRNATVRWFMVEHGGCGWRKFLEHQGSGDVESNAIDQWARGRSSETKVSEYKAVLAYLRSLTKWLPHHT